MPSATFTQSDQLGIVVTGASGFVGRRLLMLAGCHVATLSLRNDMARWLSTLQQGQCVVHLAARVHVMHEAVIDPLTEFRKVNVEMTLALARMAAIAQVKRFVFISTVKANGEATQLGHAFVEDEACHPQDVYGISKHEAEQGLRQIAADTGMEVVIIRSPLVYGPGVKANFASLMHAVQKGWPLPLGAIHNKRSLVALDNLVDFIITCISHPEAANQTFLISDGQDLSTTELVQGMAQAAGLPARLLPVPVWALEWAGRLVGKRDAIRRLCGNLQIDSSKARELLNWVPKISVQEGLRRAMNDNVK